MASRKVLTHGAGESDGYLVPIRELWGRGVRSASVGCKPPVGCSGWTWRGRSAVDSVIRTRRIRSNTAAVCHSGGSAEGRGISGDN
jgi:hypothetical protein